MAVATLVTSGVLSLLSGLVYNRVGVKVGASDLAPDERRAVNMFKAWWHALAGITYISAVFLLVGAFGTISLPVFEVLLYFELGIICLALWGLTYYLVFLFTGKAAWFWPMGVFYVLLMVWLFYLIVQSDPNAVVVEKWQVTLEYANEDLLGGSFTFIFLALFIGPTLLGAIGYFTLFFRTKEPKARYRIGMVSLSLIVWLGSGIVANILGINEQDWWRLSSRVISVAAALVILMAYQPPAWIRGRLGMERPVSPT